MKDWLNINSWKGLITHLALVTIIGLSGISIFFYIYLPLKTNHGETITVPNVVGIGFEELHEHLTKRNLRFEITKDSSYSPDYPPLAVLKQVPAANAKVKENRKIYLTLNASSPPMVKMPDLLEGSLKNAQMVLKTYDLILGTTTYKPDLFFNTVLQQRMNGREVLPGEQIPKGSVIDVVLGDGYGNQELESPNLISLDEESARFAITGSALKIGRVEYEENNIAVIIETNALGEETTTQMTVAPGEVFKQSPEPGTPMKIKDIVHIWIYKPDSVNLGPTLLDLE